MKFSINYPLI